MIQKQERPLLRCKQGSEKRLRKKKAPFSWSKRSVSHVGSFFKVENCFALFVKNNPILADMKSCCPTRNMVYLFACVLFFRHQCVFHGPPKPHPLSKQASFFPSVSLVIVFCPSVLLSFPLFGGGGENLFCPTIVGDKLGRKKYGRHY